MKAKINLTDPATIYFGQHRKGHGTVVFFSVDSDGNVLYKPHLGVDDWTKTDATTHHGEPVEDVAERVFSWFIAGLLRG